MATISWANAVSGDWSDAADWTPAEVPGSGDTAEIGPGISAGTAWTVSVTTEEVAAYLIVATGGFGTLSVGAVLDLTGAISVASGSVVVQPGGTLATPGALTLGEVGSIDSSGTLTTNGSALIAAASLQIFDGSVLAPGGAAVALGNATITAGELTVGSDASVTGDTGTIEDNVDNAGTILVVAEQSGETAGALTIVGTLSLPDSALVQVDARASLTVAGDVAGELAAAPVSTLLSLNADGVLTITGSLTGAVNITSAGGIVDAGWLDLESTIITLRGGRLTDTGTAPGTIDDGTILLSSGAVLSAPALALGVADLEYVTLDLASGANGAGGTLAIAGSLTLGIDQKAGAGSFEGGNASVSVGNASSISAAGLSLIAGSTVSVTGSGAVTLGGAAPVAGAVAIASGATLAAEYGTIDADVSLGGIFLEDTDLGKPNGPTGNETQIEGTLSGNGALRVFDDGATVSTLEIASAGSFTGTVTIQNGSELILDSGSMASALIDAQMIKVGPTSDSVTVDLRGLAYAAYNLPLYNAATGILTIGTATLDVGLGRSSSDFGTKPEPGSGTGTEVTITAVPCFLAGTRILTRRGEVPVEQLQPGDQVATLSGEWRPLRWIGFGRALVTPRNRDRATPVVVRRHALAPMVPHRDLYITRGHSLFLEGVLIPVEELINHRSIAWVDDARVVEYYHLETDGHDVVFAEGAAAETYRDDDNSALFQNAPLRPAKAAVPPCAPVLHEHPTVKRIWRALSDRAGQLDIALTADPDLHLLADGERVDAESVEQQVWRFRLQGRVTDLRIVSRSAIPSMIGLDQDQRRLGIAVRRIVLRNGRRRVGVNWDAACLAEGFHAPEPAERHRWTNGRAAVPPQLVAALRAGATIDLHVGLLDRYVLGARSLAA